MRPTPRSARRHVGPATYILLALLLVAIIVVLVHGGWLSGLTERRAGTPVAPAAVLTEAERAEREAELVERLGTVAAGWTEEDLLIYRELVGLDPGNDQYRGALDRYEAIARAEEQNRLAREAFVGEAPQRARDGTYPVVRDYLVSRAHDPRSVRVESCSELTRSDDGWAVVCDWRATGRTGATVRSRNRFVIRQGQVVGVQASAVDRR
jgi:hypothetical protein